MILQFLITVLYDCTHKHPLVKVRVKIFSTQKTSQPDTVTKCMLFFLPLPVSSKVFSTINDLLGLEFIKEENNAMNVQESRSVDEQGSSVVVQFQSD